MVGWDSPRWHGSTRAEGVGWGGGYPRLEEKVVMTGNVGFVIYFNCRVEGCVCLELEDEK